MWGRLDDSFSDHDKVDDALNVHPHAVTIWSLCASRCNKAGTDGVVQGAWVTRYGRKARLSAPVALKAAEALVDAGLWHDAKTIRRCDHCSSVKLAAGQFFFHDWWDFNLTKDESKIPAERMRWRRKSALKHERTLLEAIATRDGGHCRYCGVRVNWTDRRGRRGGTYDHVDPDLFEPNLGNLLENVVTACRKCNGEKRDRTPVEWVADGGRDLLPEPTRSDSVGDQVSTRSDSVSRARSAQDGPGRVGPGVDLVATESQEEDF